MLLSPEMRLDDAGVQPRRADWENFVDFIGRLIVQEQSPERLLLVRSKLYELLTNCIPPDVIMKVHTQSHSHHSQRM